jgi:type I restriction enzyme S subunit
MSKEMKLIPELRFPEFEDDGEWGEYVFKQIFVRLTDKNDENNQNVLTISAQLGLVSQLEYFNKKVSAKDVTGYYLLHKNDFAYNKSYSKGYPMGAIKPLKYYEKGVVSTLYICFRPKDGYNHSFFEQYFDAGLLNSEIAKIAQEGGRAHGLLNVSVKEFFSDINLLVPKFQEQQKIASCLSSLDELIAAHNDKLGALKDYKKGLLQNLFPNNLNHDSKGFKDDHDLNRDKKSSHQANPINQGSDNVPKVRFPAFAGDGEWVEKELGKICDVRDGTHDSPKYVSDGFPLITSKNLLENGEMDFDNVSYLTQEDYDKINQRSKVDIGDILFGMIGTIGNPVLVKRDGFAIKNVSLIKSKGILDQKYLIQLLKSNYIQIQFQKANVGGILKFIALGMIRMLFIPTPKLEEQQKIASCLSAVDDAHHRPAGENRAIAAA